MKKKRALLALALSASGALTSAAGFGAGAAGVALTLALLLNAAAAPALAAPRPASLPADGLPAALPRQDGPERRVPSQTEVDQALQAVALAAEAARQSALAASAASDRIAVLERTLTQLRSDAEAQRQQAAQLQAQLEQAQRAESWVWLLGALALGMAGLSAGLLARMLTRRSSQAKAKPAAAAGADRPVAGAVPGKEGPRPASRRPSPARAFDGGPALAAAVAPRPDSALAPAPAPVPAPVPAPAELAPSAVAPPRSAPAQAALPQPRPPPVAPPAPVATAAPAAEPPEPLSQRMAAPPGEPVSPVDEMLSRAPDSSEGIAHDASIDELLDLEQQAEFFVLLGQDEAAIDLLAGQLRNNSGGSPMPYLKLLEIYRRMDRRGEYELLRARFNHRFNAYAPEWEADLQAGRTLEDYPGVLSRLQSVWSLPREAMAELDALVFRKPDSEPFELPAYRDVMLLYTLSRDLMDRVSAQTGEVDLLLPLSDPPEHHNTAPMPTLPMPLAEVGMDGNQAAFGRENQVTLPVSLGLDLNLDLELDLGLDLDLTQPADRSRSIFDPLEAAPSTPRRA